MVTIYTQEKSKCTIIQVSPQLKYKVYDNGDHYQLIRILLDEDGITSLQVAKIVIPKDIAPDIGKVLKGEVL